MRYAKRINNHISFAPCRMRIDGDWVYNPTDAQLLAEGYLPIIEADPPVTDEQHYAVPHWTEQSRQIVQSWTVEEIPITDEEALTRYANSITGANDPDIISAAETLIEQRIKED